MIALMKRAAVVLSASSQEKHALPVGWKVANQSLLALHSDWSSLHVVRIWRCTALA
jgi:hypothetical protein